MNNLTLKLFLSLAYRYFELFLQTAGVFNLAAAIFLEIEKITLHMEECLCITKSMVLIMNL